MIQQGRWNWDQTDQTFRLAAMRCERQRDWAIATRIQTHPDVDRERRKTLPERHCWEKNVNLDLPGLIETSQGEKSHRSAEFLYVLSFLWADRKQKMRKRMRADQMRIADVASTSTWRTKSTKCSLKGKLYRDSLGFLMLWLSLSFKITFTCSQVNLVPYLIWMRKTFYTCLPCSVNDLQKCTITIP